MLLYRDPDGPIRQAVGIWQPRRQMAVLMDVVLYRQQGDAEIYDPPSPESCIGTVLRDAATARPVARIAAYDPPDTTALLRPVVWCQCTEEWPQPLFRRLLPPGDYYRGLPVKVGSEAHLSGVVTSPPMSGLFYPQEQPCALLAFEVLLETLVDEAGCQGAPIVWAEDERVLLGMVLRAYRDLHGQTILRCSPAFHFVANP